MFGIGRWCASVVVLMAAQDALAQVGACCIPDTGACIMATQADCADPLFGQFQGVGVTCADDTPCATQWGACCTPDGCIVSPDFVCNLVDGATFLGAGVACAQTTYVSTPLPTGAWADMSGATALTFVDDGSNFGATDEGHATLTLPAPFLFDGEVRPAGTTLEVHTNGFVSFDRVDVTNRPDTPNFRLEFAPDASTPNAAICPLWSDQLSVSARTRTIVAGGTTTLVIEWTGTPFAPDRWGGTYQLHLVSSSDPTLDGAVRFLYDDGAGATPFDSPTSADDRLFIGVHSFGGLAVFRPDLGSVRDLVENQGFGGVEYRPVATGFACVVNVCAADIDGDGDVDFQDFLLLSGTFGDAGPDLPADVDGSGAVDFQDFLTLSGEFGRTPAECLR